MPRAVRIVRSEEVVVVGSVTRIKAQQYRTAIDIPMWAGPCPTRLWRVAGMAPTVSVAHQPTSEHHHGIGSNKVAVGQHFGSSKAIDHEQRGRHSAAPREHQGVSDSVQ